MIILDSFFSTKRVENTCALLCWLLWFPWKHVRWTALVICSNLLYPWQPVPCFMALLCTCSQDVHWAAVAWISQWASDDRVIVVSIFPRSICAQYNLSYWDHCCECASCWEWRRLYLWLNLCQLETHGYHFLNYLNTCALEHYNIIILFGTMEWMCVMILGAFKVWESNKGL